ncbi:MAG: hypothetical protein OXD32_02825, partial [Endozoicomonadaceae bacterium]|nr:hypothetical protein [Endozoicomonadaceae bacterium]
METWLFLGKWNKFSLLHQLACVYSKKHTIKKQYIWINLLSLTEIMSLILNIILHKLHVNSCSETNNDSITHRNLPNCIKKNVLNLWIKNYIRQGRVIIFTENPSVAKWINKDNKQVIWVYVRPACIHCALHIDHFFKKNDTVMVEKADLIINDNELNKISAELLSIHEQKKKIYQLSMPFLIFTNNNFSKQKNTRNTAGFYGPMDAQINIDLIIQSAMAMPSWKFELYITDGKIPGELKTLPNVFIYKNCIENTFFHHWDIALLPYSNSIHHTCCNPPMIKDYISYGLPIVSTTIPATERFSSFIVQQRPKEPFSHAINRALQIKPIAAPVNFQQDWNNI